MVELKNKTISLVLGSGGARGYAHIGVIEVLEKKGCKIMSVSGTSMGALVGGLYCCGKLEEFKQWVLTIDSVDMIKLLDFSFSKTGLIQGDKVFSKIEEMIGDIKIEDLPIPFTAVATDIVRQKEVWLQKGRLIDAIRASIAIPTIFTPKKIEGKYLVDGGILNPLPVAPTVSDNTDLTVSVGLYSDSYDKYEVDIPKEEEEKEESINNNFMKCFQKANNIISSKFENNLAKRFEDMGIYSILWHTIDTMQNTINNYKLAGYPPDIEINISKYACEFYEFNKAYKMIEVGRSAAEDILK